jgi:hypothetical protein
MANVAKHTYKHGDTKAWIEVSELARPEDLTRAIAHELEEIVALMESRSRNVIDPAALVKGSHATELSHHDRGRKAELKVLLYELEHQPGRRADILKEITALVDHLGFSPTTITSDARAAKLLGGDTVVRLDKALAGKRRFWVKEAELRADERLTTKEWKFWLEAPSPDGRPHDLVTASVMLDDSGRPMSGPSFYLDNRVQIQHGELRITVGEPGTPTSITDLAIQRANTAFKNRFGHDPTELPGSLAYDNKEIFIREYISRIDKGVDAKTAAIQAAKATPFVQARDRAGYRDVEVKPFTSMKKVVYGDPPRIREVPDTIEVIARKK